jgi:5'-nucleotidase
MNFLVVNDDGIESEGIRMLVRVLSTFGSVYVCAPFANCSGQGARITIHDKVEIIEVEAFKEAVKCYKISGSPADCVRIAVSLFDTEFDCVVSGINLGNNLASDIFHSGTCGAAFEAKLYGLDAISFSAVDFSSFFLSDEVGRVMGYILRKDLQKGEYIVNVNFPKTLNNYTPIKMTRVGKRLIEGSYTKLPDSNFYKVSGSITMKYEEEDSDIKAVENGTISISLVRSNLSYLDEYIKDLKK